MLEKVTTDAYLVSVMRIGMTLCVTGAYERAKRDKWQDSYSIPGKHEGQMAKGRGSGAS